MIQNKRRGVLMFLWIMHGRVGSSVDGPSSPPPPPITGPACVGGRGGLLPGAATAAAPAEAAGVRGVGGGVSHSVARLEDTGSCFAMNLHLLLTHLHPLWAHGLQREDTTGTTVRAVLGRGGCLLEDYCRIKLEHRTHTHTHIRVK